MIIPTQTDFDAQNTDILLRKKQIIHAKNKNFDLKIDHYLS